MQVHIRVKERRSLYARLGFTPSPSKMTPALVGELGLANLGGQGELLNQNFDADDLICIFIPLKLSRASSERFKQLFSFETKPTPFYWQVNALKSPSKRISIVYSSPASPYWGPYIVYRKDLDSLLSSEEPTTIFNTWTLTWPVWAPD